MSYILCATICFTGKVEKNTENFFELVEVYDVRNWKYGDRKIPTDSNKSSHLNSWKCRRTVHTF